MLTAEELNEVQGLLHYLNTSLCDIKLNDFVLIASDGEQCAKIGTDDTGRNYVLKVLY